MSRPDRHLRVAGEITTSDARIADATRAMGDVYVISIRGRVGAALCESFAPLAVCVRDGRTEMQGPVEDQAALYGILARIQSLGLQLDEVVRLRNASHKPDKM